MLMDVKTMSATASGLTLEPAAKLINAGTTHAEHGHDRAHEHVDDHGKRGDEQGEQEDVLRHGAGEARVGDPGVHAGGTATEPTAMAAVRNMRDLMSTAFQLAGVRTSPMMGMARATPMARVTQPI